MKQINKIIFAMALMMVIILNPISVKATEDIPGIHSSFLKYNAEKNAVPSTLNILSEREETYYDNYYQNEDKLVKNNTMNANIEQVSKMVVWIAVLVCIGMLGFLILF